MAYGLYVWPDDGGKFVDISSSARLPSFCQNLQLRSPDSSGGDINTPIPSLVPGSTPFVVPRQTLFVYDNYPSTVPITSGINSVRFNGTTFIANAFGPRQSICGNIDIYQCLPPEAVGGQYGIYMQDASNFTAITDTSKLGFVVWRGVINVSSTWTIPTDIPNRASAIVFARWNDTSHSLYFDRDNMRLGSYNNINGSLEGSINNVQVVIITSGFSPANPNNGFGVVIRNANGVNTYSSKYPPMIWRGGSWTPNSVPGNYTAPVGNVSQPMVALCSLGYQWGGSLGGAGGINWWVTTLCGLRMSGNSITAYGAYRTRDTVEGYTSRYYIVTGISVPCIDAADYF